MRNLFKICMNTYRFHMFFNLSFQCMGRKVWAKKRQMEKLNTCLRRGKARFPGRQLSWLHFTRYVGGDTRVKANITHLSIPLRRHVVDLPTLDSGSCHISPERGPTKVVCCNQRHFIWPRRRQGWRPEGSGHKATNCLTLREATQRMCTNI